MKGKVLQLESGKNIEKGYKEGFKNGFNTGLLVGQLLLGTLINRLIMSGRSAEVRQAVTDRNFREKLYKECDIKINQTWKKVVKTTSCFVIISISPQQNINRCCTYPDIWNLSDPDLRAGQSWY